MELKADAKRALDVMQKWHSVMATLDIPAQALTVFYFLAAQKEEEVPQQHLGEALGMSEASVSRNLALLSGGRSASLPGPGLIQGREDPAYRRRKLVSLTPKGRAFLAQLVATMRG